MKKQSWKPLLVGLALIVVLGAGCTPDITISEFTVGTVKVEHDVGTGKYYWVADATVKVKNDDEDSCDSKFWVGAKAGWVGDPDYGMYSWKFTTSSFTKQRRWECGPLDANEEVTYTGTMYIWECNNSNVGETIDLWVTADPTTADKPEGKISEDDETNNFSVKISKVMPPCN